MANIYSIGAPGIAFVDGQCMLGIYNGVGSGKIIKLYRALAMNAQTQTVTTPTQLYLNLYKFSTGSGGLAMNIIKHDNLSPTPPAQIVASANMSYTIDSFLRRMLWSTKEPLVINAGWITEVEVNPNFTMLWDSSMSYNNSSVEPLVLREGYGAGIVCSVPSGGSIGTTAVADFFLEVDIS